MSRPLPLDFTLLQVIPRLDAGGVEQTTLDMSEAVVRVGRRSLVASQGGRLDAELLRRGGGLVRMPLDSKNPLTLLVNAGRLAAVIRKDRVSLVHARSRAPAYSALWAARTMKVAFVTTYHGVYKARSPLKRAYNAVMASGDLVIANSAYTRDHLLRVHDVDPDRVVAISRGVDMDRFDAKAVGTARVAAARESWGLARDDDRAVILLAGRLTRWKGQILMVEAAARLRSQCGRGGSGQENGRDDFVVVLAGDDQGRADYRLEVQRLIAASGLQRQVKLAEHCQDMPAAYLACDIAVAPSLEPEAFGRTAVEPQAMGRPVLAADHGAARETVLAGETGWLVAPGDADAWAAALGEALAMSPSRRRTMGAAGRARVRRLYSLDAMTDATLDVYARVLEMRAERARA